MGFTPGFQQEIWITLMIFVVSSEATFCKRQNCGENMCCVRLIGRKGLCNYLKNQGEACHPDSDMSSGALLRSCPCKAPLKCVPSNNVGFNSIFGYNHVCAYEYIVPTVAPETYETDDIDYSLEITPAHATTTTTKMPRPAPITSTTNRSITTPSTTTRRPTTTPSTTTRKPATTPSTTTIKPTTTSSTTSTTTKTEISSTPNGETRESEEDYDYDGCTESGEKNVATENNGLSTVSDYDYGTHDYDYNKNTDLNVMPPESTEHDY